jgi:hypothetical protein
MSLNCQSKRQVPHLTVTGEPSMAWSRFDFFVAMLVVVSATARGATTILRSGLHTTWPKPETSGKWTQRQIYICNLVRRTGREPTLDGSWCRVVIPTLPRNPNAAFILQNFSKPRGIKEENGALWLVVYLTVAYPVCSRLSPFRKATRTPTPTPVKEWTTTNHLHP